MQETNISDSSFTFNPDELGDPLVAWDVDEYPLHERSKKWYVIVGIVGVALIVYAIATANFLFAVIILMFGVILLMTTFVKPNRISVIVTSTGVVLGDMYYDYQSIRDFSIAYNPPHVKILYLDFYAITHPLVSIPLEDIDPNIVRDHLLSFCMENLHRTEESLTDKVKRLYKL